MNEFIKKLIEGLEEREVQAYAKTDGGATYTAYRNAIEIVNQLAEEYKSIEHISRSTYTSTDLICKSAVIKELNGIYLDNPWDDKEDILEKAIGIVDHFPTACNNGWIPYTTGCKMPNEASRVWLSFTTPITSFVKSAWYINGHFEWDNCRRVKETPMAWKPYVVPAPYQPKGE